MDCKLQWLLVDHPEINNDEWTKEEDKLLLSLVSKYQEHDWETIAQELDVKAIS